MDGLKSKIEALQNAALEGPKDFARALQDALTSNFDVAFESLKTRKTVLRQRSHEWIASLEHEVAKWLPNASLKGKQKAQLRRHLAVSKAIQQLLDLIDQRSAELPIWKASTENLLRSTFAWIEDRRFEREQREAGRRSEFSDSESALRHMDFRRRELRFECDYVARIVNQISALGVRQSGSVELSASDIQDAIGVAAQADIILHILDCYTYKSFRISVEGKHIEMHGARSQYEEARTWSALREGSRGMADVAGSPWRIADVRTFARTLNCTSASFAEFIQSHTGSLIFQKLENLSKDHNRILRREVGELIDLDFALKVAEGNFRASELLDCWSLIYRIALTAHIWKQDFMRTDLAVLPISLLLDVIAKNLECNVEQASRLFSQFFLDPSKRNQDPFFRPLIKLNDNEVLLAGAFIETSRFSRNLFTIAIREGGVDFAAKGLKPLKTLLQEFENAGYEACINFPLLGPTGLLTDVDIAATKDGFLFLGQTKVLINPDTNYDDWKVFENLRKAAAQMEHCVANASTIARRLGLAEGSFVVMPFLLTNIWDLTGAIIGKFKVVDFSYLSFLLRGAERWIITFHPDPRREVEKLIAGDYPTGEELFRLLQNSLHEKMFRKPRLGRMTYEIGDWRITVPIDNSALMSAESRDLKDIVGIN